jgi:hypothetical protein
LPSSLKTKLRSHSVKNGGPPVQFSREAGRHAPLFGECNDFGMPYYLIPKGDAREHMANILGMGGTR